MDLAMIEEIQFPPDFDIEKDLLFPSELEKDALCFFHGTGLNNLESIVSCGLRPSPENYLESVSYSKNSKGAIEHAAKYEQGIIIVFKFSESQMSSVVQKVDCIHVYENDEGLLVRPEPIAYMRLHNSLMSKYFNGIKRD